MSDVAIRPLGSRVLIKPNPKRTESAGGLAIVEDWQPDTSGIVVALGDGPEQRREAVHRAIDATIERLEAAFVRSSLRDRVADFLRDTRDQYRPEHVCTVGDEVTFGVAAGTELDLGGELYLLVDEADLETLCEPIEEAV